MSAKRETRAGEIRAAANGIVEILAVTYLTTDDYNTQFQRGTFTESLEERLPVIAFGHQWTEPIGRATGFREADEGLYLTCRLDIGGNVPRADQAYEQALSGTLTDVSVGFVRRADEERDGVTVITKADLDEVSFVLRGAVPGAKVLAVRSARSGEVVDLSAVEEIARRVVAGDIDQATADEMARLLSAPPAEPDPEPADVDLPEPDGDVDLPDELVAEAEQILERAR